DRLNAYAALSLADPEWIEVIGELTGEVEPDSSVELTVALDASEMLAGSYGADINIASNDPESSQQVIAVDLTVLFDAEAPAAVSDLQITDSTSADISLQWTAVGDDGVEGQAEQYDIRYSTTQLTEATWSAASAARGVPEPGSPGTVETSVVKGLLPNTDYWIGLKVKDNSGQYSGLSNVVETTTPGPPELSNGVALEDIEDDLDEQLLYRIEVPANATDLSVSISGGLGDADLSLRQGAPPTTSEYDCRPYVWGNEETCSVSSPTAGTYYVMVHAYSAYSGVTLLASYTPAPDSEAPTVPDNVAGSASSSTAIALSWDASTDEDGVVAGYKIYRGGVETGTSTTTSFTDTGLSPATSYAYTVSAYDNAEPENESSPSSPAVTVATLADTQAPTAPDNVAGSASSSTVIALTWAVSNDVGGGSVAGYKVYRDGVELATTTSTSYSDTGLTPATSYAYTVSAYDDADPQNESNPSSPAVNVVTDTPSGNPERLSIVVDSVGASSNRKDLLIDELANGSQNLGTNWNNDGRNANAWFTLDLGASYDVSEVFIAPRADRPHTFNIHVGDTLSSGKVTAAAVGTCTPQQEGLSYPTYLKSCSIPETTGRYVTLQVIGRGWLRVHGVEIWGSSGDSGGGDTDPPTVPDNVAGSASSSTAIALSWDASTDVGGGVVAGYKVYRDGVLAGTSTTTGFTDTGLSPATSYAYTVSAYDDADPANTSAQSSPAVNVVTLDTPPVLVVDPLSIADTLAEGESSSHTLTLENTGGDTLTYSVSITGRQVSGGNQDTAVYVPAEHRVVRQIPKGVEYVPGELIVKLAKNISTAKVTDLRLSVGASVQH
ncbi:MAG: fibronectin type III domain-containing protein, partial [Pseudomonadota bacterium]|nr:fibronectin type III domain-containing protein [Pseudomonadota bacterium]